MAEAAVARLPEQVTSPSEIKPPSSPEIGINRFSVRRLRVYEGSGNKSDIFNNGDVYGLKYAVPFQLRTGSQASEQGGSQLAFSADPKDPKRFLISEDVRTTPENAVVLEQRGDQLFVRSGNQPQQIYERGGVRQSLTGGDFRRNSLVVPVNSEFSLAVTGFNPESRQIIAQKVLPQSHFGEPLRNVGLVYSIDPVKRPVAEVMTNRARPHNYFDRNFPSVLGPGRRTEVPTTFRSVPTATPTGSTEGYNPRNTKLPTYSDVLTTTPPATEVSPQVVSAEVKAPEAKATRERGEFLKRINILKNTTWGKELAVIIGGIGLVALLSGIMDRSIPTPAPVRGATPIGFGPTQEPVPTQVPDAVIRPPVIPTTVESKIPPKEPATVLETNMKDQSTWGVFLHHLGKLDASALESAFPAGIPDNLRAAWDSVREVEAQTGQFVKPDDPLLLDAVGQASQFLGKDNVQRLYGNFLQDIQKNNPNVASLSDATPKTDERYGTQITDNKIVADTLKMRPLEDVVKDTFATGQRSVL